MMMISSFPSDIMDSTEMFIELSLPLKGLVATRHGAGIGLILIVDLDMGFKVAHHIEGLPTAWDWA